MCPTPVILKPPQSMVDRFRAEKAERDLRRADGDYTATGNEHKLMLVYRLACAIWKLDGMHDLGPSESDCELAEEIVDRVSEPTRLSAVSHVLGAVRDGRRLEAIGKADAETHAMNIEWDTLVAAAAERLRFRHGGETIDRAQAKNTLRRAYEHKAKAMQVGLPSLAEQAADEAGERHETKAPGGGRPAVTWDIEPLS